MAAVTQQSIWDVMERLDEEKKRKVYNFAVYLNGAGTPEDAEFAEYKALMMQSQQWAKDVGLTPDDITEAIKTVRQRKRQFA